MSAIEIACASLLLGCYLAGLHWVTQPLRDYAKNHPDEAAVKK